MTHHADNWPINRLRKGSLDTFSAEYRYKKAPWTDNLRILELRFGHFVGIYACSRWRHGKSSKIVYPNRPLMTRVGSNRVNFWTFKSQTYHNFNSNGNIVLASHRTNDYYGTDLSLQVYTSSFSITKKPILDTINVCRIRIFSTKSLYCCCMLLYVVQQL